MNPSPIKNNLYLPNGVLQLFIEQESFSFKFFIIVFIWVKDLEQGKGKWEEGEYLGPGILWLTDMKGSLAVRLEPESVIICFWGHKKPTEPCSVKQRNTVSSESNQGLNHWPSEWLCLYFFLLYGNEEETLDFCAMGLAKRTLETAVVPN